MFLSGQSLSKFCFLWLLAISGSIGIFFNITSALACGDDPVPVQSNPNKTALVTSGALGTTVNVTAGMIAERVSTSAATGSYTVDLPKNTCVTVSHLTDTEELVAPRAKSRNSIWSAASYDGFRRNDIGGDYHGGVINGVVGYDRLVTRSLILGVALGFENVDIVTGYDAGTLKANSGAIAPYVGIILTDWLVLDASLGYTKIAYDFMRMSNATKVTGKTDATRYFGSIDLTAAQHYDRLKVFGQLGYLELSETQSNYTESNNTNHQANTIFFGQVHATIGTGYDVDTGIGTVTPSVSVRYEYDVVQPSAIFLGNGVYSSHKPDGVVFGLGVDVKTHDELSFVLKGTTTQFRDHTDAFSVAGNVKYRF